ncbi:MAG: pyridoxamine 5'-phosphate oxidase family protein [Hyphomicrobiales bacterium]|nr:pyridoxamine 5'-phosphate oxidase family protein [Hyphomicrobiales bacterium]
MARITSFEQLRTVLAQPRAATKAKVLPKLDEQGRAFIAASPFALLATSDQAGILEVSPKGDAPGFVKVEDEQTLLMPDRPGNNLAYGLQNIIETERAALIFLMPGTSETFRVSGRAEIRDDADLLAALGTKERPSVLAIRLRIERCYFHCARALLRSQLWQPDSWPEPIKVSFGRIIAPRVGGDETMARQIDESVDTAMTQRLWKNT